MLSLEGDMVPPELLEELRRTCSQCPAMRGLQVRERLRSELGPAFSELRDFEDVPFAAASLGQVHGARLPDGTPVAVKVRYPGIHRAIRSDVRVLRQLFRALPDARFALGALEEFRARVMEEADYRAEAAHTRWFGTYLDHDNLDVPAVWDRWSGDTVLTTTRMPGQHLEAWLATSPSQAEIDRACQTLYDVLVVGLRSLGRIHADANWGNSLFATGGRTSLIDFGCVRAFPAALVEARLGILRAALRGDDAALLDHCWDLGMLPPVDRRDAQRLRERTFGPLERWLCQPFREERFDFGADPGFCAEGREAYRALASDRSQVRMPVEVLYLDRTIYSLYRTFARAGARVDVRGLIAGG